MEGFMYIDGVQDSGMLQSMDMSRSRSTTTLTDDQKKTISTILSKYDASNISADNAKAIFKAFSDAGIQPQRGMKEAIESAGFDADKLRQLGMPQDGSRQGPPPPPPPSSGSSKSSSSINTDMLKQLQNILDEYDLSNLDSDQKNELYGKLADAGLLQSGNVLDIGV
jgi:hypothetical protein